MDHSHRRHASANGATCSLDQLTEQAAARMRQGFAPPAEIYRVNNRDQVDWSAFPSWARPVDPDLFDGCCHEG